MSDDTTQQQLTLFVVATPAPSIPALEATVKAEPPTCPDTSLPWSDDYALDGWSARMFLHQLLSTSTLHWWPSDTEQLLSDWMPQRLQASIGSGISLSDVIKPPGQSYDSSFRTARMVRGMMRRVLRRSKSLRVLLRTEHDTIPVTVTFWNPGDSASWTVTSESVLPDFLRDGLLDFLRRHAPDSAEMP